MATPGAAVVGLRLIKWVLPNFQIHSYLDHLGRAFLVDSRGRVRRGRNIRRHDALLNNTPQMTALQAGLTVSQGL